MTDLIKKIILTAAVLFSGIAPVLAHKDTSFNSPHKLELKPASFAEPGYQLAKSYWLGGADIDLGFKGDDDATVCQSRGYTTGSCGTNQEIVSYCGAGNQYHRCGCNDRIYRYDDITCGQDAYPDMSDEYVCKTSSSGSGKSDRCICYADDQRWIDGSCVFYCSQDSHCADDEICITSTGQCEFKDCEIYGCDGGQVCYNHYCEVPNCVNGGTSCVQGEKCDSVSKQCVEDPNTCPSGYQESACSDKQISDGSNHTTSSGKVCYACRAKTCDDLNCDSVRQTCNSAALICVDKAGCSSGDSTTACKSDQKSLGTYVADNGDTCYQCQDLTCEGILADRGYGIDSNLPDKTNVIISDMTFARMEGKTYIGIDNFSSISQCRGKSRPKLTFNKAGNLDGASFTNLNLYIKASDSGNIEVRNGLTLKNTAADFTPATINVPAGARIDLTDSKLLKGGSNGNTLKVYGSVNFNGTSETGNVALYDSGKANIYSNGKVNTISTNSSSAAITVSSGGKLEAVGSSGVTIASGTLTINGNKSKGASLSAPKLQVSGTMKAPYASVSLSGDFIVNSGASFSANNTTVSAVNGKLYNGASVSVATAVNLNFSGKFSCAVSKITFGSCDSLSPQNNDDYGISAYEYELGRIDGGNAASNTQISLCGGSKMSFNAKNGSISGSLNQYNSAKICLEYWATFYCSGNIHGEGLKQSWIKGQTGFTWSNCKKKYSTSNDKC